MPPGEEPGCGQVFGGPGKEWFLERCGGRGSAHAWLWRSAARLGTVCEVPGARRGLLGAAAGAGYGTGKKFPVALGNESGRRERCLHLRHPPGSGVWRPPSQLGAPVGSRVTACLALGSLALHLAKALRREG